MKFEGEKTREREGKKKLEEKTFRGLVQVQKLHYDENP